MSVYYSRTSQARGVIQAAEIFERARGVKIQDLFRERGRGSSRVAKLRTKILTGLFSFPYLPYREGKGIRL